MQELEPNIKRRTPVWTTSARADVLEQYLYIAASNPPAADRFAHDFERKLRSYASNGLTGVNRGDLQSGLRSFVYRQRVIYFTLTAETLIVARVFHGHEHVSPEDFTESSNS